MRELRQTLRARSVAGAPGISLFISAYDRGGATGFWTLCAARARDLCACFRSGSRAKPDADAGAAAHLANATGIAPGDDLLRPTDAGWLSLVGNADRPGAIRR